MRWSPDWRSRTSRGCGRARWRIIAYSCRGIEHGRRPIAVVRAALTSRIGQERLEHQQAPQRRAVVAQARLMCIDELPQVRGIEESGVGELRAKHRVAHARAQGAAEPCGEWHRKSHL